MHVCLCKWCKKYLHTSFNANYNNEFSGVAITSIKVIIKKKSPNGLKRKLACIITCFRNAIVKCAVRLAVAEKQAVERLFVVIATLIQTLKLKDYVISFMVI